MDSMLAVVVILLVLGSLVSAQGPDIGGRRPGS
jgi:hypothetical protein